MITDFELTDSDLCDALDFALPIVNAEMAPHFTGGHIFLMARKHDDSPTGQLWLAFTFHINNGHIIKTHVDVFDSEDPAQDHLNKIAHEVFAGYAKYECTLNTTRH